MREIKFRVWDKQEKTFVKYISLDTSGQIRDIDINVPLYKKYFIISQYTGLKDKNGKEIYEGDILNGSYIHNEVVKFGEYEHINDFEETEHIGYHVGNHSLAEIPSGL